MEYVTTDTPVHFDDVTLIPVIRICHYNNANTTGYWLSGSKEPLAIIVCDSNGVRARTMSSSEIPIADLMQKIPNLNVVLEPYQQR